MSIDENIVSPLRPRFPVDVAKCPKDMPLGDWDGHSPISLGRVISRKRSFDDLAYVS